MTQELILTSVSQGLEPNDQGFCPVAESGTVPPQLVMRLKSISSFKHLFPPESEDAAKNPIAYSHLIVPALDSTFHILSRIADSGVDYQHQPNRLAHHIVLGSEEQVPEGPAWILAQHAFHITQWLTPAVRFVQGRPLPTLTAPPPFSRLHQIDRERQRLDPERMRATVDSSIHGGSELPPLGNTPCPIWKQLTGDAGWGGVLAATIRTGRPVAILFEPGTNVLPLFVESLALLPPAMKWKATFSTYFSAYPEHVACQWKAVPVDSSEARQFRDDSTVLLIDLTTSLGKAMSGPYVEYARTGAEHSLPENEIQADLFEDAPEIFENLGVSAALNMPSPPPLSTSSPISEKAVGESFGSLSGGSDFPDVSSGSSKTSPPPISIQTSSDKSPGVVGSLLNMKSRGSFYAMFGATFLCVLFLSLIVADQLLGLGIFYQVPSKPGNTAAARQGANPPNGAPTERNVADGSKLNPTAIAAEQKRLADEQEKKAKESEQLEQQRKESVEQARKDYEKKLQAEKTELDRFLQEFPTLKPLSLRIPAPEDPARKQLFSEFTELYRWGAAIHFEFVPLLKNPRIRIETRKIPRFLGDPPDSEHELLVADDDSQANGTDAKTSKLEKLENSLPPDRSNLNVEDGERIPDPTRLEWSVLAVNTGTDYETPLLRLKLTPQGLSVDWSDAALSPQYYDDAALLRLGFLRFGVEGVKDLTKIHSVPLFETTIVEPVYPSKVFGNTDTTNFDIPTPLADEPWKSIFAKADVFYTLRLDVAVHPEFPSGVEDIEALDMKTPDRFFVNIKTSIRSKRNDGPGQDSFHPIIVAFEAVAEPSRIRWIDRYVDQRGMLDTEREGNLAQAEQSRRELNDIQQKLLNLGGKQNAELSKSQQNLNISLRTLDGRRTEIDDILGKFSDAHDKIIKNEDFRFEFSLFLLPRHGEGDSETIFLRSEETVPLMKTAEK